MVLPNNKADEILSNERLKYETYCSWFMDRFSLGLVEEIKAKYSHAKTQAEKEGALSELNAAITIYSTLVHSIYPNDARFRKMVDGSRELSGNFAKVSEWVNTLGGKEIAEEFASGVESLAGLAQGARGD